MPLQHLGQLKPTMQQQIALQRALLALAREDEEIRRGAAEKPALARRLGAQVMPYAGPTPVFGEPIGSAFERPSPTAFGTAAMPRPGLEHALATGTPGYISGEERMRMAREGITAEREGTEAEMSKLAAGLYERLLPLDEEGRRIVMDAVRTHKPDILDAMEKEGYISPEGVLAEPEEEKKLAEMIMDPQSRELIKLYESGMEERTGRFVPEEKAAGPTISEQVSLARLQMDVEKYGARNVEEGVKNMGDMPRLGETIEYEKGKYRDTTSDDIDAYWTGVREFAVRKRMEVEGPRSLDDVKYMFADSPESIKQLQRTLGVPETGWFDKATERMVIETFTIPGVE